MANDFLGGLGGLMKGLGAFMPQDDPNTKIFTLQNELNDLQERETNLYAGIGKKVYGSICNNPEYSAVVSELGGVQLRLSQVTGELKAAQDEKAQKEKQEEELRKQSTCPQCGGVFEPGIKFCNECGCKLGLVSNLACPECGGSNPPETKFCGECGHRF